MLAALQSGLRPREPRVKVLVPARMRLDQHWCDVTIHNVSSRGLMAGSDATPQPGSYVEIRRGTIVIVARVMWARGRFFGMRSQDKLSAKALVDEPRLAGKPQAVSANDAERRSASRLADEARLARRTERARLFASAFQFGAMAATGITLAALAASVVYDALARPMGMVTQALGGH